ncbi:unnamed protein product [Alopecurus aequalis]
MDIGLYKSARAMRHKTAVMPTPPQAAANYKAKPAAVSPWPLTPAPPPGVVTVQVMAPGNGMYCEGDADVDRRAALYISRVQERLRRERAHER